MRTSPMSPSRGCSGASSSCACLGLVVENFDEGGGRERELADDVARWRLQQGNQLVNGLLRRLQTNNTAIPTYTSPPTTDLWRRGMSRCVKMEDCSLPPATHVRGARGGETEEEDLALLNRGEELLQILQHSLGLTLTQFRAAT